MTSLIGFSETLFITLKIIATIIFIGFWLFLVVRLIARGRAAYHPTAMLPLATDDAAVAAAAHDRPHARTTLAPHGERSHV